MRLFVLGHSYVTAFAQAKYVAMKQLAPDLALRIVVPDSVSHLFGRYRVEVAPGLAAADVLPLRSFGGTSHMTYTLDPLGLAKALRTFEPTHIHIEEDPHAAVSVELLWLARLHAPRARVSFFLWDNLNHQPRLLLGLLKRRLVRRAMARASLVLCGNREAQELLALKGYTGRSRVVPQIGLDQPYAPTEKSRQIRDAVTSGCEDAVVVGYLGRLVPEKGILQLLQAFERATRENARLLIVGAGPMRSVIEQDWRPRLRERLTLLDPVPHGAVNDYLAALDVFVLPSYATPRWKEQFGLTLAQAMLCGVACVASHCDAMQDVLDGAGLLVKEADVESLTSALTALISSPQRRRQLGREALYVATHRYTAEAVATAHLNAFASVA